jgi:hypothetical protein
MILARLTTSREKGFSVTAKEFLSGQTAGAWPAMVTGNRNGAVTF